MMTRSDEGRQARRAFAQMSLDPRYSFEIRKANKLSVRGLSVAQDARDSYRGGEGQSTRNNIKDAVRLHGEAAALFGQARGHLVDLAESARHEERRTIFTAAARLLRLQQAELGRRDSAARKDWQLRANHV